MTTPGAGRPIDVAFVEIVPDTSEFVNRLRRETREAFGDLERTAERAAERVEGDLEQAADDVGKAFDKTADGIADSMQDAATDVTKSFDKVNDASVDLHRDIDKRIKNTANVFDKQGNRIQEALEGAFQGAQETTSKFRSGLGTLGEALVSIGSAIVGLGVSAPTPAGLIAIGIAISAIVSLAPLVAGLVAALADLAGLITVLPAGLSVLAAAVAPLVVAFQGFGEAIEAVISKDPKKIEEALSSLAPAARRVVLEFADLLPQFERLGDIVQEDFFRQFEGSLTRLANALLPTLTGGLSRVATELGKLVEGFAQLASSAAAQQTIADIFATTERVLQNIGPALGRFFEAALSAVRAGLPLVERIATAFAGALDNFSAFLSGAVESGQFQQFFEDAVATVGELVDLGKALGGLFVTLFGDLDDAGRGFIGTLTDLVVRLDQFFQSAEGQELLTDLERSIPVIAKGIGFLVNALVEFLDLTADVRRNIAEAGDAIGNFFGRVGDAISGFLDSAGQFFSTLDDRILGAIQAIPGLLLDFFGFLFDQLFTAIGRGIGLIIFAFTELPGLLLAAVVALPGLLTTFFRDLLTDVTTTVVSALQALIRIFPELLGQAVDAGRNVVVEGFNNIVAFIRSVPGRIRDAFLAAGNLVVEIGTAIGNALKTVINRAIDRINDGIRQIDDVLPGTLPRIPRLEHGGLSTEETLAQISEGNRREAILPLEDPRAMRLIGQAIADATGGLGSALFGPGSIVIQFSGALPTPAQAQQVGRDVGAGMAAALARRDARLGVRTL